MERQPLTQRPTNRHAQGRQGEGWESRVEREVGWAWRGWGWNWRGKEGVVGEGVGSARGVKNTYLKAVLGRENINIFNDFDLPSALYSVRHPQTSD